MGWYGNGKIAEISTFVDDELVDKIFRLSDMDADVDVFYDMYSHKPNCWYNWHTEYEMDQKKIDI